jgi:hypothetical protein
MSRSAHVPNLGLQTGHGYWPRQWEPSIGAKSMPSLPKLCTSQQNLFVYPFLQPRWSGGCANEIRQPIGAMAGRGRHGPRSSQEHRGICQRKRAVGNVGHMQRHGLSIHQDGRQAGCHWKEEIHGGNGVQKHPEYPRNVHNYGQIQPVPRTMNSKCHHQASQSNTWSVAVPMRSDT